MIFCLLSRLCRAGEAPSTGLTEALVAKGFETDRLKTGTPARVDRRSINFQGLEPVPGDDDVRWFSFDPEVGASFLSGLKFQMWTGLLKNLTG